TAASVSALQPDAVVVATGGRATKLGAAKWHPMPVPGSEQDFVLDHEQALRDLDAVGPRVVILDPVGHIEAIGIGELRAASGREVTAVTTLPTPILPAAETATAALPRAARGARRCRHAAGMVR